MYSEAVQLMGEQAAAKLAGQRRSLLSHVVRSMLAGMYVGAAIVLIFTIAGSVSVVDGGELKSPGYVRLLMGVCFGGALTMVIFAGSELFTGSNLVLTLGVLSGRASRRDLAANWVWTWIGNLLGSVLLAVLVVRTGLLDNVGPTQGVHHFVLKVAGTKMNLPPEQLFWRAVLANWLVCLGVWMAARTKSDTAKILLIWWCMFTFITCGFEHSVANMCGLMLALLLPHGETVTWAGYAYNLGVATLGNIVGGALLVGGMYWLGSPAARTGSEAERLTAEADGAAEVAALVATEEA